MGTPPDSAVRVYLLDDDPVVNSMVERVLGAESFQVFSSTLWSVIGRKILKEKGPAVLVSDLNLPGIKGEDFCRSILSHSPDIPVILYSGADPKFVASAAERLGNVRYVLKQDGGVLGLRSVVKQVVRALTGGGKDPQEEQQPLSAASSDFVPPYLTGKGYLPVAIGPEPVTIGRHPERNLVVLCSKVSRNHTELTLQNRQVMVRDLGSRNGTWLNNQRLEKPALVSQDATMCVGSAVFQIRLQLSAQQARELCTQAFEEDTQELSQQDFSDHTAQA